MERGRLDASNKSPAAPFPREFSTILYDMPKDARRAHQSMPLPPQRIQQHRELLLSVSTIARAINGMFTDIPQPAVLASNSPSSLPKNHAIAIELNPPSPLTTHLVALGLHHPVAQCLSRSYLRAAHRLKALLETHFRSVYQACVKTTLQNGFTLPDHLSHIRVFYEVHFSETVALWAQSGMTMTRDRLMIATLKPPLANTVPTKV